MWELCKTRTKKSSPNMFNFYLILASHDVITDIGKATTFREKIKAQWLQTKVQKRKDHSKTGKTFGYFRRKKKQKQNSWPFKNT